MQTRKQAPYKSRPLPPSRSKERSHLTFEDCGAGRERGGEMGDGAVQQLKAQARGEMPRQRKASQSSRETGGEAFFQSMDSFGMGDFQYAQMSPDQFSEWQVGEAAQLQPYGHCSDGNTVVVTQMNPFSNFKAYYKGLGKKRKGEIKGAILIIEGALTAAAAVALTGATFGAAAWPALFGFVNGCLKMARGFLTIAHVHLDETKNDRFTNFLTMMCPMAIDFLRLGEAVCGMLGGGILDSSNITNFSGLVFNAVKSLRSLLLMYKDYEKFHDRKTPTLDMVINRCHFIESCLLGWVASEASDAAPLDDGTEVYGEAASPGIVSVGLSKLSRVGMAIINEETPEPTAKTITVRPAS